MKWTNKAPVETYIDITVAGMCFTARAENSYYLQHEDGTDTSGTSHVFNLQKHEDLIGTSATASAILS